ncbi:MAG: phage tail protein I [Candidatus Cloacimonetes bacterium]|nr:phage tail protein I [Candidatus Cloacimonadota bacterium]
MLPSSIQDDPKFIAASECLDSLFLRASEKLNYLLIYSRIDELDEQALSDLAWQFNLDWYEGWSLTETIDERRYLVKEATKLKWHKGTRFSIERVADILNMPISITEWWEDATNELEPGEFKIEVDTSQKGSYDNLEGDIIQLVYALKNVRSHLKTIQQIINQKLTMYIGVVGLMAEFGKVFPPHKMIDSLLRLFTKMGSYSFLKGKVLPKSDDYEDIFEPVRNLRYKKKGLQITVSNIPSTVNRRWNTPVYGNGVWVTNSIDASNSENFAFSMDGVNWRTTDVVSTIALPWKQPVFGGDIFVAVADQNTNISQRNLVWSIDGIIWTPCSMPGATQYRTWNSPVFANEKWLMTSTSNSSSEMIARSSDGKNWSIGAITGSFNSPWNAPVYANGIWIVTSNTSKRNQNVARSTDGIAWTIFDINTTDLRNWQKPIFANYKWIVLSTNQSSENVAYSEDGINWFVGSFQFNATPNISFDYLNGYLIIGTNLSSSYPASGYVYSSLITDGINWTQAHRTSALYTPPVYADGKWMMMYRSPQTSGFWDNNYIYSTNGTNWTENNIFDTSMRIFFTKPVFKKQMWMTIAMTEEVRNNLAHSTDGLDWQVKDISTTVNRGWNELVYADGKWCTTATNNTNTENIVVITYD